MESIAWLGSRLLLHRARGCPLYSEGTGDSLAKCSWVDPCTFSGWPFLSMLLKWFSYSSGGSACRADMACSARLSFMCAERRDQSSSGPLEAYVGWSRFPRNFWPLSYRVVSLWCLPRVSAGLFAGWSARLSFMSARLAFMNAQFASMCFGLVRAARIICGLIILQATATLAACSLRGV